ncbi:hypothetical protein [Variovorax ginsengisoli]|uniref:Transmembrane protein n=1 Tax=Variovorax ginsengisoli TaxID=363844 RepID=A0ABT8S9H3_9BURK|nr:hypothetical protein [Variovorax ginsengisoli]MDN8615943.1 hypothetical protein [Variovorax ginsengisoli]MDO1535113.1 hypothetical protein [Variovorax ginsengisoli]
MRHPAKLLRAVAAALLIPVLLFEEWGWEPLARATARLAKLRVWARIEVAVRSLPPWGAVLAFFLPALMLLPVKLFGLFLLGEGHAMSALLLLLVAKLVGTAILARLFQLVEPALMQLPWFARFYPRWKGWKDGVLERVRLSAPWRAVRRARSGLRRWWHAVRHTS